VATRCRRPSAHYSIKHNHVRKEPIDLDAWPI
jgi:hypothetical protein